MTKIGLTIAGSDSGGGAGIQADLKTFSACGVYGASVITALTAQNTQAVTDIHDVPSTFIAAQLDAIFDDLAVNAVKIGMLSRADAITTIAERLARYGQKTIVLDPVMVAESGDVLLADDAIDSLVGELFPQALLVTPNLHEAARLLDCRPARDEAEMTQQAQAITKLGARSVLLKGGHSRGKEAGEGDAPTEICDILIHEGKVHRFCAPFIATRNTHGTGCSLSSAIAAHLAHGFPLVESVEKSKKWLWEALAQADSLAIGRGAGPVHHFHQFWREGAI